MIEAQELIVLRGKVQAGAVTGEAGDDASVLFAEPGGFERLAKVLPASGSIGGEAFSFIRGQRMDRSREGTNGLLDALIGRRQFELGIERFEVMTKLLTERQGIIGWGCDRVSHSGEGDDTGRTAAVTTSHLSLFTRRIP